MARDSGFRGGRILSFGGGLAVGLGLNWAGLGWAGLGAGLKHEKPFLKRPSRRSFHNIRLDGPNPGYEPILRIRRDWMLGQPP